MILKLKNISNYHINFRLNFHYFITDDENAHSLDNIFRTCE